jgi:hypothetical protein
MKTVWFKGLNEAQKKETRDSFLASAHTRLRLIQLLEDKITTSNTKLRTSINYESPSWAFQQADGIGYERAILEIISLIDNKSVDKV